VCGVAGEQDPAFTEPVCDSVVQRWASWSDDHGDVETVFTRDDLLSDATIWWAGDGIATSIRTYANNHCYPWTPSHDRWPVVEAPTGSTFVGYENPLGVTTAEQRVRSFLASDRADWYRHVNLTAHDHGGHFIRGSFRPSGSTTCAGPSADSADRRRLRLVRLLSVVMVETESADSWPSTSCFPPSAGTRSAIAPMVMPLHTPSPTYSVPPTRMSQSSRLSSRRLDPAMGPGVTDAPASSSDSTRAASR